MLISLAFGILHSLSETFNFQPHYWQRDLYPFGIPQIFFTFDIDFKTQSMFLCIYWVSWAVPGVSAMAQLDCWRWYLKLNMEIIITNHISPRPLSTVVSLLTSEISASTSSHQFTILHAYCRGDPLYSYRWKLHNRVFYSIHKVTFCFSFNVLTWFLLRHRNAISSRCRVYLPSLSISRPPSVSPHQARRLYARAAPC